MKSWSSWLTKLAMQRRWPDDDDDDAGDNNNNKVMVELADDNSN